MKKVLLLILAALPFAVQAQEEENSAPAPEARKQWRFVPAPIVGYNSDRGLQLGASCSIFCYSGDSPHQGYLQKFRVGGSYYFTGSGTASFLYDSRNLIRGTRFTTGLTYIDNPVMSFYGFNGAAAPYHPELNKKEGIAYYSMTRNSLRVTADLLGNIRGPLNWAAGLVFWYYDTGLSTLKKYRENAGFSLYNLYREYGVIRQNEAAGGSHLEFRAELVFDTRDSEDVPSRGVWAEVMISGSPDMFQSEGYNYLKFTAHFRHYVPIWEDRITFAYHLAWQGTVAGRSPFYLLSNISTPFLRQTYSEGLGGASTMRGMRHNRIVGKGVAWANAELRIRLVKFRVLGQQWAIGVNPLFDIGMVVQPHRLDQMKAAEASAAADGFDPGIIYSGRDERPHMSAGVGAKLSIERDLIFSVEWAKPFDKRDGSKGLYVGANYVF